MKPRIEPTITPIRLALFRDEDGDGWGGGVAEEIEEEEEDIAEEDGEVVCVAEVVAKVEVEVGVDAGEVNPPYVHSEPSGILGP